MSTVNSYFKVLLELSGNDQLTDARRTLLQSINDKDLRELLQKCTDQHVERGQLEEIFLILLDVIAKKSTSTPGNNTGNNITYNQEGKLHHVNLLYPN